MLPDPGPIPFALPDLGQLEIQSVVECISSGWLTAGAKVKQFEVLFAAYLGVAHAVSCNSATTAALLLLEALHVGPGDEVIVPTWTFSGPAMMAHKLGATVVLADVELANFSLSTQSLRQHATRRTKAVIPTHFAGASCDTPGLLDWCQRYSGNIALIDDAAHAFPTVDFEGAMVGMQGARATFFSFYATKTLTTGEGGMIVTEDAELADRLRRHRSHGFNRDISDRYTNLNTGWRYDIAGPGWKANMTDIAAAIGLVQLQRANHLRYQRRLIGSAYWLGFQQLAEEGKVILPAFNNAAGHAWHLYPLRVTGDRDRFIAEMGRLGIQCSMHFIPLHQHSFWKANAKNGLDQFPNADLLATQEVSLPIYSKMSLEEVHRVINAVRQVAYAC